VFRFLAEKSGMFACFLLNARREDMTSDLEII